MQSGSRPRRKTTQVVAPPDYAVPYLKDFLSAGESAFESGPPLYFGGSTVAPVSTEQEQAWQMLSEYAQGGAQELASSALGANQFLMDPSILSPDSNPYLGAVGDTITRRVNENLTQNILPSVRGGAVSAGQVGSSRQGIAEGLATQGAQTASGDALADLYSAAYGQGLEAMTRGVALAPQTNQLGVMPGTILEGVGATRRGIDQQFLDADIARHEYEQMKDWLQLSRYGDVLATGIGMGGQQTSGESLGTMSQRPSALTRTAGGAAAGAGVASALSQAGIISSTGGWGAAIIGLGALAGYMG